MRLRLFGAGLMRRTRFRLRTLMIAVAVVSIPLAVWATIEARRVRFLRAAAYHKSQIICIIAYSVGDGTGRGVFHSTPQGEIVSDARVAYDLWRVQLWMKYEKAAEHPWMPVAPDPPPPDESESGKS
jgi:hypothetical protein